MALFECPKCGRKISDKAFECPQCGWKNTARKKEDKEHITKSTNQNNNSKDNLERKTSTKECIYDIFDGSIKAALIRGEITSQEIVSKNLSVQNNQNIILKDSNNKRLSTIPLHRAYELMNELNKSDNNLENSNTESKYIYRKEEDAIKKHNQIIEAAIKASLIRGDITTSEIVDKNNCKVTTKEVFLYNSKRRNLSRIPINRAIELLNNQT